MHHSPQRERLSLRAPEEGCAKRRGGELVGQLGVPKAEFTRLERRLCHDIFSRPFVALAQTSPVSWAAGDQKSQARTSTLRGGDISDLTYHFKAEDSLLRRGKSGP